CPPGVNPRDLPGLRPVGLETAAARQLQEDPRVGLDLSLTARLGRGAAGEDQRALDPSGADALLVPAGQQMPEDGTGCGDVGERGPDGEHGNQEKGQTEAAHGGGGLYTSCLRGLEPRERWPRRWRASAGRWERCHWRCG